MVERFLLCVQFLPSLSFDRNNRIVVQLLDALIARIPKYFHISADKQSRFPEQPEIVLFPARETCLQNLFALEIYDNLRFYGMLLFLSRVPFSLFFFGLSMPDSAASTTMASMPGAS